MRTASQVFYLAFFSLFGPSHAHSNDATRSRSATPNVCAIEPTALVSDACASYDTIDSLNTILTPSIKAITQTTDFFAYYRLNLFNQVCPFWNDASSMCGNIACAVNTLDDEEEIPTVWRAKELSKLEGPKAEHPGRQQQRERGVERPLQGDLGDDVGESCVVEYDDECDDRDYCIPDDETASAKGDYVSLVDNPERYTGYAGEGAHMVWDAIYKENCFSKPSADPQESAARPPAPLFQAASDLRSVLQANAPVNELVLDDTCLEKRVFYRVISGMHASISTHLCHDFLNQTTGVWGPNLACYQERLASHPDRISNLYFNYALVLRAVAKLRTHLETYTFCSGDARQDADTKAKVLRLADAAASGPTIFDETTMFKDPYMALDMKEDFRQRFRNVSRLMDCVGCDKCRLWGKLQTAGYGTALKVLFEFEEGGEAFLKRTELVSLINTLARISNSLNALEEFRIMSGSEPSASILAASQVAAETAFPSTDDEFDSDTPLNSSDPEEARPIMNEIYAEVALVMRTFKFVMMSWIQLPNILFKITVLELARLWAFWLGLEVPRREYEFSMTRREDL